MSLPPPLPAPTPLCSPPGSPPGPDPAPHPALHLAALDDLALDALDARLAQPWLDPPDGFEQRVMAAVLMDPGRAAAPAAGRRREAWARWVLLGAGLLGLGECLSFLAGLWLASAAAL
jgi:hypothetical protein